MEEQKPQRKEITKSGFRALCWTIIGAGLILNAIMYTMIVFNFPQAPLQEIGLLSIGLLVTGFGVGLAYSRMWKIKDYD